MKDENIKLLNVFLLSFNLLLVFTGFLTISHLQQLIFNAAKDEGSGGFVEGFNGDSFTSLAIVYLVFAAANWIAPSVIVVTGPRLAMLIATPSYLLYMGQLLYPNTVFLYSASVLVGIGAALLNTAKDNFLTINSNTDNLLRNSGLYGSIVGLCGVIGNTFAFSQFHGLTTIDESVRMRVGSVFLGVTTTGSILMLFLRPTPWMNSDTSTQADRDKTPQVDRDTTTQADRDKKNQADRDTTTQADRDTSTQVDRDTTTQADRDTTTQADSPIKAFVTAIKLFGHCDMQLLIPTGIFVGLTKTFWQSVYATCLGFTQAFGSDAKSLAAINAITSASAEILTCLVITWLACTNAPSKKTKKFQGDTRSVLIVMIGLASAVMSYISIFLILPKSAPLGESPKDSYTYISPNKYIAISCSFLFGVSNACFNTQILATIGKLWYTNSSPAFAFFQFVRTLSTAVAFFYSSTLTLNYQLAILLVTCVVGGTTFCIVLTYKRPSQAEEDKIEKENAAYIPEPEFRATGSISAGVIQN